ncbi:MAG: Dyp-type peroxidase [Deltaproteobacteria bacterium]|nr:Dyp-type peroxidase [Deltaproteobacteria bacterium]
MSAEATSVDLADVQAIVLRGFRYNEVLPHFYVAFVSFSDTAGAPGLVARLLPHVTSCTAWDQSTGPFVLNLGLSPVGLTALGQDIDGFPAAFVDGMASRAKILGDIGDSAPEHWEPGYRAVDVGLAIFIQSKTTEGIAQGKAELEQALQAASGAKIVFEEDGNAFPDRAASEHFGFVDGIGQPFVEGSGLTEYPGEGTPLPDGTWAPIKTGSFVLGYTDEFGNNLFPDPPFRNGSYLAFRKLHQRVAAFRAFTAQMAAHGSGNEEHEAARLVGRWRSGAPLDLADEVDDPGLAKDWNRNNDFRYSDDARGFKCPHGAHARRGNPRADPTGPTLQQVREHRIIRHGVPYGPWLPEGAPDDGQSRGIYFMVVNASPEHQFEYVQQNWMNGTLSSTALSTEIDRDPLVGANDGKGKFVATSVEQPTIGWGLSRFVDVRGGAYFFMPSLTTLRSLAQ